MTILGSCACSACARSSRNVFHRLLTSPDPAGVQLQILPEHFPFILRSSRLTLTLLDGDQTVDVHAVLKAGVDPEGVLQGPTVALDILAPNTPAPTTPTIPSAFKALVPLSDPHIAEVSITPSNTDLIPGWVTQTWIVNQHGLSADTLDDLVLVVKYTVPKP